MSIWRSRRALILLALLRNRRARRRNRPRRTIGVRSIFRRQHQQGEFHNLLEELLFSDPDSHFRYLRMSRQVFDKLLEKVSLIPAVCSDYTIIIHILLSKDLSLSNSSILWKDRNFHSRKTGINSGYLATGNSQVWFLVNKN